MAEQKTEHNVIGRDVVRLDGRDKATGRLKYMGDVQLHHMAYLGLVHPPFAHANILNIDVSKAEACEGVITVVTAKDIPGKNIHGLVFKDQVVISDKKVVYRGDTVAVVVAETEEIAAEAVKLVEVEYEELPAYMTAREALAEGAVSIHEEFPGNLLFSTDFEKGDVEAAFAESAFIEEHTYHLPYQSHCYLETECGVARPTPDGGVEIWCPNQNGSRAKRDLEVILDFPPEKIHMHSHPLGGGFGGKDDLMLQGILCVAALKAGRPVYINFSREESFIVGPKRVPIEFHLKTGIDKEGHILAHTVDILGTAGSYASYAYAITFAAMEYSGGIYRIPNYKVHAAMALTNNTFCSAMRGFGVPQACFAIESQMDIIAKKAGIDPMEFHKINAALPGEKLVYEQTISPDLFSLKTLEAVEQSDFWKMREEWKKQAPHPWIKRGIGLAAATQAIGVGSVLEDDYSFADIYLNRDGRLSLIVSTEDMGQGSMTAHAMIAAEAMGMPLSNIDIINGNMDLCPDSQAVTASSATLKTGNAILYALDKLKEKIAAHLDTTPDQLSYEDHKINGYTYAEIAAMLTETERRQGAKFSFFNPPEKLGFGVHYTSTQIAQATGVEVNTLTGQTKVLEFVTAPSAGTVINKLGYEGQCDGGVVMGQGYGLLERYIDGKDGMPVTKNFQTYLIPTMADMPPHIDIIPVEDPDVTGPYGARGIGEPVTVPTAGCIANAIEDAIGIRFYDLPMDQEKVLLAIEAKKSEEGKER